MAVVFDLDEISLETKKELLKELTLIPKDPYAEKMKKWGHRVPKGPPPIPIQMFLVDSDTRTVRLPFHCAMTRMGEKPNRHKIYPKLCTNGPPKFQATFREYQKEVIDIAYEQLQRNCTTTLGLYTGWGKSLGGMYLATRANGVIMIFVHRSIIADGWITTIEECFPQLLDTTCYVGKYEAKKEILIPRKCDTPMEEKACGKCEGCTGQQLTTPGIIICLVGRIHKVPQHVKDAVMVTIIDEADFFCTPCSVDCLLSTEPKFVIAETATLERPDGMESMIHSIVGTEGILREPDRPYRLYRIQTGIKVPLESGKRGLNFDDMTKKLISCEERNRQAVECILCNPHRKIMVFVRQQAHIGILGALLEEKGIEYDTLYGGKDTYQDSHVLIGTIPKMGVGFDEKNACASFKGRTSDMLIMLTSVALLKAYIQMKGRMRSNDAVVFYFEDNLAVVKGHIKSITEYVVRTMGEIIDKPYEEGDMYIPNMDYSTGVGVEVGPTEEEVLAIRQQHEAKLAALNSKKVKTKKKIIVCEPDEN